MARGDVESLTWSIRQFAQATGISERTARSMLAAGQIDGVVRIGGRVLVLKQRVIDQLMLASGVNPHPELEEDAAAEAAEKAQQERETERALEPARKAYQAMCEIRRDGGTSTPQIFR